MNKNPNHVAVALWLLLLTVCAGEVQENMAVICIATELAPCYGAMTSTQAPSSACCSKLREQRSCLCGYLRNPALRPYINPANAQKVALACRVPTPTC